MDVLPGRTMDQMWSNYYFYRNFRPKVGDILKRQTLATKAFDHYGMVYAIGFDGSILIIENTADHDIRVIDFNTFCCGLPFTHIPVADHERPAISRRMLKAVQSQAKYGPFSNCEDFVNEMRTGVPKSEQRDNVLVLSAMGLVTLWALKAG